jgi:hypothetical protein
MVYTVKKGIRSWRTTKGEENPSRWATLYVTINRAGHIVMNRIAHESLGSPEALMLLFDEPAQIVGLKPAHPHLKDAFPSHPRGRHGGRRIKAHKMCKDFGIFVSETLLFPRAYIDHDGVLILDLNDIKAIRRQKKDKGWY